MAWVDELETLKDMIVRSFARQANVRLTGDAFSYEWAPAGVNGIVALVLETKRTDDMLRLKAYLTAGKMSSVGRFRMTEEENYGPGLLDEVWISNVTVDTYLMRDLVNYIRNIDINKIVESTTIAAEQEGFHLVAEDGVTPLTFD